MAELSREDACSLSRAQQALSIDSNYRRNHFQKAGWSAETVTMDKGI